jgi:hypothetical protein
MTNLPAEVQQQLNEVVDYHPDLEVDRETHFKCFFVYPAAILNLMEWHDEFFIDRFRFTQDIYRTYCEAHPYFAEKLLDGHLAESMSDELHEEVDEGISRFNEVLGLDSKVSIPDDHGRGTRILMYAIWYRELDESGSVDTYYTPDEKGRYLLVSNPKTSEYRFEKVDRAEGEYAKRESEVSMSEKVKMSKYSTESIERMAELALDGQEVVRTDGEYEDLTSSGALDSTLSLLKKTNPDDIIRGLAEAGDDTAF